jgi:signal transduction histidine kinase/putative methionine-R-sulfoxide reductase with GAF domain
MPVMGGALARQQGAEVPAVRTRQLEAVCAATTEITRELNPTTLLQLILQRAVELVGAVSGAVYLWDDESQSFVPRAWHGLGDWMRQVHLSPGDGLTGTVAQRRSGIVVNDYRNSPYAHPVFLANSGMTACIAEPLFYQDQLVGVITINNEGTGHSFTEGDLETLTLFSAQAGIAIENARLFSVTDQRARELDTLREVDQLITARLELPAVLEAIVAGAMQLLGTQHTQLFLWDEEDRGLRFGAAVGTEAERVRTRKFELGEGGNGTVALTRQPLLLNDYQASPHALPEFPDLVATLTVPVLFEDRLLGVLHTHTTIPGKHFAPDDLRRFQTLAGQAAIAIEHARLSDATARQLTELRALHETGLAIASSLSLDEQLEVLVQRLCQAARAQRILVALVDSEEPERFRQCLAYVAMRPDPWLRHLDLSSGRYPELQEVVRTARLLVIPDVPAEARLDPVRGRLEHLDLRSMIVVPLIVRGRAIGAVSLGYVGEARTFPPEEISLLQSFAAQAAIAIEKARLYEETQQRATELEQRVQERTCELEAANRQLQAASRHKSEFLATMSHELRTPLNSVMGFSQLLLEQIGGTLSEKHARFLGHVYNSGKHLLDLINDILDLSKVEAGKLELHPEPLAVAQTLEDILVIGRALTHKKAQRMEADIEPDLPPLHADPVRFKQILFNLLSNAVKFTPDAGSITLRARRLPGDCRLPIADCRLEEPGDPNRKSQIENRQSGEWLEIAVADTGVGIRPADLSRLFQGFTQLETTQAQRHEGTGLGLALTKRLVEAHSGCIWAESAGEGKGSTFTVLLPFAGPGDAMDETQPLPATGAAAATPGL